MLVVSGMMLAVGLIGHEHLLFRGGILKELALAMLEYADDAVGKSFDVNNFIQRVPVWEKCFAEIVADDGDVRTVQILGFSEIAADVGLCVINFRIVDIRA